MIADVIVASVGNTLFSNSLELGIMELLEPLKMENSLVSFFIKLVTISEEYAPKEFPSSMTQSRLVKLIDSINMGISVEFKSDGTKMSNIISSCMNKYSVTFNTSSKIPPYQTTVQFDKLSGAEILAIGNGDFDSNNVKKYPSTNTSYNFLVYNGLFSIKIVGYLKSIIFLKMREGLII